MKQFYCPPWGLGPTGEAQNCSPVVWSKRCQTWWKWQDQEEPIWCQNQLDLGKRFADFLEVMSLVLGQVAQSHQSWTVLSWMWSIEQSQWCVPLLRGKEVCVIITNLLGKDPNNIFCSSTSVTEINLIKFCETEIEIWTWDFF